MTRIKLFLYVGLLLILLGCAITGFGVELKSGGKDYYLGYENQGDSLKPLRHQYRQIVFPPVNAKQDSTLQYLKQKIKTEAKNKPPLTPK